MQQREALARHLSTVLNHKKLIKMKNILKSTLVVLVCSTLSFNAIADTLYMEPTKELETKIEQYVTTVDQLNTNGDATIYTNLLVKEDGLIYTVDFMVSNDGDITVLNKEEEDEFYKVDLFNAKYVERYEISVPSIVEHTNE